MTKTDVGLPAPRAPRGLDVAAEARKGRHRLYPVSAFYGVLTLSLLAFAMRVGSPPRALGFFALGIVWWTWVEYFAHRWVLHGVFPNTGGPIRRWLHRRFDDLHWRHHQQPWDGLHINGTIGDTLPFTLPLAALSFLWPVDTAPSLVAGLLLSYVVEEWVHHSVHFYRLPGAYFRYIRKFHLYHHSPRGSEVAYGLTNGVWDVVYGTRIPPEGRALLFR